MSRGVLLLGLAQLGVLAALGWAPGARGTPFPALLLWTGAFVLHLAAAAAQARRPASPAALWGTGLAMRAVLLPLPPHFSGDIWRYLWDGRVQLAGVNPYALAPADPVLEPLRMAWHSLVNHPEVPTIYPPGAQIVFLALAAAGPSVLLFKLAWVAADLGVARVLQRLTSRPGSPASPALVLWLWSPLVLVEVAWSGHLEPLGILPMMGAVLLARRAAGGGGHRRSGIGALGAGALLGLGAAVKLAPLAALPGLWRRHGTWAAGAALAVPCLLTLPYLGAGAALVEGLRIYAERWAFNPGLFRGLEALLGDAPARMAAGLAVGGVAALATVRRWPLDRILLWTIGSALLLSPTLHPWYVLWVLPLAILRGNAGWVLLAGLVFFGYAGLDTFQATGRWPQPAWLSLAVHGPVLLLLGADALAPRHFPGGGQVPGGEQAGEGNGRQEAR